MRIFASRQCTDYVGAGEERMARVAFAIGLCLVCVRWAI